MSLPIEPKVKFSPLTSYRFLFYEIYPDTLPLRHLTYQFSASNLFAFEMTRISKLIIKLHVNHFFFRSKIFQYHFGINHSSNSFKMNQNNKIEFTAQDIIE